MIAAEGEQKASRALREASSTIAESSAALQLRYLQVSQESELPSVGHLTINTLFQTLNSISAEKNSTIIFPVPLDIMSQFMRWGKRCLNLRFRDDWSNLRKPTCWYSNLLFLMEANRKLSLPPTPTQAEKLHMHNLMLRIGSLNNGWAFSRVDCNVTPKYVFTVDCKIKWKHYVHLNLNS